MRNPLEREERELCSYPSLLLFVLGTPRSSHTHTATLSAKAFWALPVLLGAQKRCLKPAHSILNTTLRENIEDEAREAAEEAVGFEPP